MTIHDLIKEKAALAAVYAEEGAFHSAARVFGDLGRAVKNHAMACDRKMLESLLDHARADLERADYIDDFARHQAEKERLTREIRELEQRIADLPDPANDPINLQGSGPAPIEPREG